MKTCTLHEHRNARCVDFHRFICRFLWFFSFSTWSTYACYRTYMHITHFHQQSWCVSKQFYIVLYVPLLFSIYFIYFGIILSLNHISEVVALQRILMNMFNEKSFRMMVFIESAWTWTVSQKFPQRTHKHSWYSPLTVNGKISVCMFHENRRLKRKKQPHKIILRFALLIKSTCDILEIVLLSWQPKKRRNN